MVGEDNILLTISYEDHQVEPNAAVYKMYLKFKIC